MDLLNTAIAICTLILDFIFGKVGLLDKKETADLEATRAKLSALRDGRATSRGRLAALRKERHGTLDKLRSVLAATKAHVQSLASLHGDKTTLRKLSTDAGTMRSVLSVASLYQQTLGNAGDDAFTRKLLGELNGAIKAFTDADAAMKEQWTLLKGFDNTFRKEFKGLLAKVRCTRAVVELRLDEGERAKFKGMLRTLSRRSVRHAAKIAVVAANESEQKTSTPIAA